MKKIYFSLLSIVLAASANAQLTKANHAPANGDMYSMYQCDSTNINPGTAGAASTWSFAMATHSSVIYSYTASNVTSPSYPAASLGLAASANNTSYFNSSANSLLYYGGNISVGVVVATLNYTSPAVYAAYPMSLNTSSTATTGGSIVVTAPISASGTFLGNSKVIADGTGSLTLAGNTYTDVMRIVTSQTINFTTNVASGTVFQNNYQYYVMGTKAPMLTIETSTATTPLGANSQTIVTRLIPVVNTSGIASLSGEAGLSVYPNPATSEVNFISESRNGKTVAIYDITGKLVLEQNFTDGKAKVNVSSLNRGLYIFHVSGEDNQVLQTGKLTVIQ